MSQDRRKEIEYHVDEETLDEMLREAEDEHCLRRIGFVKNLYRGDTVPEAADREGRSASTGDRWADAWNDGGFDALMPSFGGGRPSKLDEDEREALLERLRGRQPWTEREIRRLLAEEFDVEYHPDYLATVLRDLGLSYVEPPIRPSRSGGSGEHCDGRAGDDHDGGGGWVVDDAG